MGNIVKTPAIMTDIPQGLHTIIFKLIGEQVCIEFCDITLLTHM